MKRALCLAAMLAALGSNALAINVSGPVNGSWHPSMGIINVIGNIYVPSNQSLLIYPGVQVIFNGLYKFDVDTNSTLRAVGTATDSIIFRPATPAQGWLGLKFWSSSPACSLSYCKIVDCAAQVGAHSVSCSNSDLMILHCRINSPNCGGIRGDNASNLSITYSAVNNCHSSQHGGGILLNSSYASIDSCDISHNGAAGNGGGICATGNSDVSMYKSLIRYNAAVDSGGGIYLRRTTSNSAYFMSNLIVGNSAQSAGGGMYIKGYNYTLDKCTFFANNVTLANGGGLCNGNTAPNTATIRNTIFWLNQAMNPSNSQIYNGGGGPIYISWCDVQGGVMGQMNLDPSFVDMAANDFHLRSNSPCIDAGDPMPQYNDPDGTRADMGCYYYDQTPPPIKGVKINGEIYPTLGESIHDTGNLAAMNDIATDGYDPALDIPKPAPPPSNYLSIYFPHPEWSSVLGDNFMVDMRNGNVVLLNTVKIYHFRVATDQVGQTVDLIFLIGTLFPPECNVWLYDSTTATFQDIRERNNFSFVAETAPRAFDLYLGGGPPPEVDITFPTPDTLLYWSDNYSLTWTVDGSTIQYTKVKYSIDDGQTWTLIDSLPGNPESLTWTIPPIFTTYAKLKVEVGDIFGQAAYDLTTYTFNLAPDSMTHSFVPPGWHLLSIPLQPPNNSTTAIFGDDIIGPYFVYDFIPSAGYQMVDFVDFGRGYWLAQTNVSVVDISGQPELDSTNTPLYEGWNMVGCALAGDMPRDSLCFRDNLYGYGEMTYQEAVGSGFILPGFYAYNAALGSYVLEDTLQPWGGYWLYVDVPGLSMMTYPPCPGAPPPRPGDQEDVTELEWQLPIWLTRWNCNDRLSALGVHVGATTGYDPWYDLPAPPLPPSGNYLRAVFEYPQWGCPAGNSFCRDIRAPMNSSFTRPQSLTYKFRILSSQTGLTTLTFPNVAGNLPNGYSAEAKIGNQRINLLQVSSVNFYYSNPIKVTVTVYNHAAVLAGWTGEELVAEASLPTEFALLGASPNPFNPMTTISFQLPSAERVRLTVYDITGRLVTTLVNGMREAGTHQVTFDGSNLTSGVYLYSLTAGAYSATGKMALVK